MAEKASWLELCELASKEQNPEKLVALIAEIDRLLEAKNERPKISIDSPIACHSNDSPLGGPLGLKNPCTLGAAQPRKRSWSIHANSRGIAAVYTGRRV